MTPIHNQFLVLAPVMGALGFGVVSWAVIRLLFERFPVPLPSRPAEFPSAAKGKKRPAFPRLPLSSVTPFWVRWREKHQAATKIIKMKEVFPQTLGMAIQALKTGQTLTQVVDYLSHESPAPLQAEWAQIGREVDLGASVDEALTRMAARYPSFADFHQFVESYRVSRQTGANLSYLLQVLLEGMEEKNRILRKMDAMTAQARLSGLLVGILPFVLGIAFFLIDPSLMTPLVTTAAGWGIIGAALIWETIGFLIIRQMLRLEI